MRFFSKRIKLTANETNLDTIIMRNRSNSGVRLDYYQRMVQKTILKHQHPGTGLLPATPDHPHAWVRDNLYAILAVWGLALAYKKNADLDEDRAKAYELEQSVVKLMRALLRCMMGQLDKVERFKYTQSPNDALHAKYIVTTGKPAVGDRDWGHLQVDATSLYLLILAEMTASGLRIVYTMDEVAFIQNLVFYIQAAYRTPDYGIWERGDKTNHGLPELNASSIGMAKAALEALNELDLFGARGGPSSVIHVMPDEAIQCQAILQSMLPRESNSKETDAALLGIISYPAFAVDDQELIDETKRVIKDKLEGRYGCCRFLRDGYKTPKEDPNRLHYEPWELQVFENIECEWPLFFAYLVLDGIFTNNEEQVNTYSDELSELMIKREDGIKLMCELYVVPSDRVDAEYKSPKSQDRMPDGKMPHMWGQSLYVLGRLLKEGFLSPGELDPLNRRLVTEPKPDLVVQVVILAEDSSIQEKLGQHDLKVQTFAEVAPLKVYPARVLSHIFAHLGRSKKLGLTGRPSDVLGVLATSKMYTLGDKTLVFMPQMLDNEQFYLVQDMDFFTDIFRTDVAWVRRFWDMPGRPLFIFPMSHWLVDINRTLHPALVATIKKLQTGYINGTRVQLGNLKEFMNTSCVTNLTFLTESDDSPDVSNLLRNIHSIAMRRSQSTHLLGGGSDGQRSRNPSGPRMRRKSSVRGIIRRTCSIQVDPGEMPDGGSSCRSSTYDMHSPNGSTTDFSRSRSPSLIGSQDIASSNSSSCGSHPTSPLHAMQAPNFFQSLSSTPTNYPHLKGDDFSESSVHEYHDKQFEGIDCHELVLQLKDTESLHEQADIIHYLFIKKGAEWETDVEGRNSGTVKDLLVELYDKAGHLKQWWLVRHTAGMLHKKVEDLAKAATDILVRQKQLAVGLPPEPREKIITSPLPPDELANIIHEACGDDSSTAMLTQEILVYLAMFIRTEPKLFHEMLRLRVGLIIQVMASELARTLKCSGEEASDQLLNLSPYEMKTLLHHILSGKEFGVTSAEHDSPFMSVGEIITNADKKKTTMDDFLSVDSNRYNAETIQDCMDADRQGQWLRRRRLDGALNRVPVNFYSDIWQVLRRCDGLSVESGILQQNLTKEMTSGEIKFALQVEMVLNRIPQPEYRQLMVEGMMVLIMIVQHDSFSKVKWDHIVYINEMVKKANAIFIDEQKSLGDTSLDEARIGAAGISMEFYDTAPSGRFGTMSYLCKAAVQMLSFPQIDGNLDCIVS